MAQLKTGKKLLQRGTQNWDNHHTVKKITKNFSSLKFFLDFRP